MAEPKTDLELLADEVMADFVKSQPTKFIDPLTMLMIISAILSIITNVYHFVKECRNKPDPAPAIVEALRDPGIVKRGILNRMFRRHLPASERKNSDEYVTSLLNVCSKKTDEQIINLCKQAS